MSTDSDVIVGLVGKTFADPEVAALWQRLDVPWLPKVEPPARQDWVSVGNVEFGFEEFAYFHDVAIDGPPVLEQVCFYAPRGVAITRIMPAPFGLEYGVDRAQARRAIEGRAAQRRLALRDVYEFEAFTVVLAYDSEEVLESVLVLGRRGEHASRVVPPMDFVELHSYFGRPWYDEMLRTRFYSLSDSEHSVKQIKRHNTCDLVREAGLKLIFKKTEATWALIGCEIYRARVRDAATWHGDLPAGIDFTDSANDVTRKLGSEPEREFTEGLQGHAAWTRNGLRLVIVFDHIVNLIASITVARTEHWQA